jgi:glycosyltransferase involved in cell wall biosynthesis
VHRGALISFVVPAYNEASGLAATLASIHGAAQACGIEYEIVVANDASTDDTARIATEAGARVVHVSNRQISRTRNDGARESRGDRLVFIDADTQLNAAVLGEALQAFDAGVVGGGAMPVFDDGAERWSRRMMAVVTATMRFFRLAAGCFVFCRRADFEAVGGFDQRTFAGEEIMLSLALRRRGRFVILRSRLVTSPRKFRGMSFREFLPLGARVLFRRPSALHRREGNEFWYDGKR